jgi:hypothetical protein
MIGLEARGRCCCCVLSNSADVSAQQQHTHMHGEPHDAVVVALREPAEPATAACLAFLLLLAFVFNVLGAELAKHEPHEQLLFSLSLSLGLG